jgi:hypothetical protein
MELASMRRYTGQKALYEAIARTKTKSQRRGILDLLHPSSNKVEQAEPTSAPAVVEEPPKIAAEPTPAVEPAKPRVDRMEPVRPRVEPTKPPESKPVMHRPTAVVDKPLKAAEPFNLQPHPPQGWLKPKSVQLHDGRVEVSLPYTLGVTVLLAGVLLVLGAFRLGQRWSATPAIPTTPAAGVTQPQGKTSPAVVSRETPALRAEPPASTANPTRSSVAPAPATMGDHVIVLAQYPTSDDLVPVQEYFQQNGIGTVILAIPRLREALASQNVNTSGLEGNGYILVTSSYYGNPQNPGTDGYAALLKIRELGRGYKAPPGKESFAPRYFGDAYGRKVR